MPRLAQGAANAVATMPAEQVPDAEIDLIDVILVTLKRRPTDFADSLRSALLIIFIPQSYQGKMKLLTKACKTGDSVRMLQGRLAIARNEL